MTEAVNVVVDLAIEDLIPSFLRNRRADHAALTAALLRRDYKEIHDIAHRMRGVGASYGFEGVSQIGASIAASALAADDRRLTGHIEEYGSYLRGVKISFT